jgi:TetR/AcrR family transcriptional repressor of mexJK operon
MDDANRLPHETSPKRRQIAAAAEALFFAHGYGAVSMDAVARQAGVSKATLYAHFVSKDGLFASIVADKGQDNPVVESLFPDTVTDLRAALLEIGQRLLRFILRDRTLSILRIAIAESTRFPELGVALYANGPQKFCDRFRPWLDTLAAQGLVETPDTLTATHQFMALLRSDLFLRAGFGLPPPPSDEEIDATVTDAVETWLRAFAARR